MHIQEVPNKRDVLKWTQPMDDILINALLSQQSFGNRVDKKGFCLEDNDMNDTGQVDSRAPSQSATSSSRGGK
ncbi:hypothetical protein GQ457_03G037570 [Hibiscus cannabinus]